MEWILFLDPPTSLEISVIISFTHFFKFFGCTEAPTPKEIASMNIFWIYTFYKLINKYIIPRIIL